MYHAALGRGVELFVFGLPAEKRLPLRAYHAANDLQERRACWLLRRTLDSSNVWKAASTFTTRFAMVKRRGCMREFSTSCVTSLGVTTFAIDPYQIGFENEEGIESGAFWFYRKLGFRPTRREVLELVQKEEQKIATRTGYRTPARTLRTAGGESDDIRTQQGAKRVIGIVFRFGRLDLKQRAKRSKHFTELLNLTSWSAEEKKLLERIVQAKTSAEETTYLKLMQRHERLRREIIRLGVSSTRKYTRLHR